MQPKPWKTSLGALVGAVVGGALSWNAYDPARGILQIVSPVIGSAALGVFVVGLRNRQKKVGPYDPDVIAENRRGRI